MSLKGLAKPSVAPKKPAAPAAAPPAAPAATGPSDAHVKAAIDKAQEANGRPVDQLTLAQVASHMDKEAGALRYGQFNRVRGEMGKDAVEASPKDFVKATGFDVPRGVADNAKDASQLRQMVKSAKADRGVKQADSVELRSQISRGKLPAGPAAKSEAPAKAPEVPAVPPRGDVPATPRAAGMAPAAAAAAAPTPAAAAAPAGEVPAPEGLGLGKQLGDGSHHTAFALKGTEDWVLLVNKGGDIEKTVADREKSFGRFPPSIVAKMGPVVEVDGMKGVLIEKMDGDMFHSTRQGWGMGMRKTVNRWKGEGPEACTAKIETAKAGIDKFLGSNLVVDDFQYWLTKNGEFKLSDVKSAQVGDTRTVHSELVNCRAQLDTVLAGLRK